MLNAKEIKEDRGYNNFFEMVGKYFIIRPEDKVSC